MSKKFAVLFISVALVLGGAIGFWGSKYYYLERPEKLAMEEAEQQQRELDKMVRHGNVVEVKSKELTMNVTESGDKENKGKTLTVTIDSNTNVQRGPELLPYPVDLTQHIKPGTEIDILEKENKALAIYWEPVEPTVVDTSAEVPEVPQANEDQENTPVEENKEE